MTSPLDVIALPGVSPTKYARRFMVEKWIAAGRPPVNDAGRLYQQQLDARLAFENGTGSPADDPREPWRYPLAHTRFVAFDIDPTPARVAALTAQGLVRPFSYEPWHWTVPNVYDYPIVTSIPATAGTGSTPFPNANQPQEDDMAYPISINKTHYFLIAPGYIKHFGTFAPAELTKNIVASNDQWIDLTREQFDNQLDSFGVPRWRVDSANGMVYDLNEGKMVKGGMWSWAREAQSEAKTANATLAALSKQVANLATGVVTPPPAEVPTPPKA